MKRSPASWAGTEGECSPSPAFKASIIYGPIPLTSAAAVSPVDKPCIKPAIAILPASVKAYDSWGLNSPALRAISYMPYLKLTTQSGFVKSIEFNAVYICPKMLGSTASAKLSLAFNSKSCNPNSAAYA